MTSYDGLNWVPFNVAGINVQQFFSQMNLEPLCEYASQLNRGLTCRPLKKIMNGQHNVVFLLQFSNGTCWLARISLPPTDSEKLRREVDVMRLVKDKSDLPIPELFAYRVDKSEVLDFPFILMQFVPGNTAMDAAGGFDVHKGQIPLDYRENFFRSVARCHQRITAIRFDKIGAVVRDENGEYSIGPIPDLGGPFDTATDFFVSWAEYIKFPLEEKAIRKSMGEGPVDKVLNAIRDFPSSIKALANNLSQMPRGPFPLCHGDFYHSNMIVDARFEVQAVIDWEGTLSLPWELASYPGFISAMPAEFAPPQPCDEHGIPLDHEERKRREDKRKYVEMVKSAEHSDHLLSSHLACNQSSALGYAMSAYRGGKLGFYDEVVRGLSK